MCGILLWVRQYEWRLDKLAYLLDIRIYICILGLSVQMHSNCEYPQMREYSGCGLTSWISNLHSGLSQ